MKNITLNRNSYHYLLATRGGFTERPFWLKDDQETEFDFCEYTRKVFKGAFLSLMVLALMSSGLFLVVQLLMGIGFSLFYGMLIFSEAALFLICAITVGIVLLAAMAIGVAFSNWNHARKYRVETKSDSFVSHAYDSLKNRFCLQVSFIGEKK